MTNPDFDNYRRSYRAFQLDVDFVARVWYRHLYLYEKANQKPKLLSALNKAGRFWRDQHYISGFILFMVVARIFDKDKKSYSVHRVLSLLKKSTEYFSQSELRKRKLSGGGPSPDWIDDYIVAAHVLNKEDLQEIEEQIFRAECIWKKLKPIRNKFYAHRDIEFDKCIDQIDDMAADFGALIQILVNVSEALWQAECNGRKPDFTTDSFADYNFAKQDIEELISTLLQP